MTKVTLDMETFKALASSTRLDVLHALDERRKTLSELSRELDLNKATVHEHLQLLVATGLIKKDDEGRKWIYYSLTWRGQKLLHPESTTTFAVLLGLSVAAAGGGFLVLGRALDWWWAEKQMASPDAEPQDLDDAQAADAPEESAAQAAPEAGLRADGAPADDGFWDEDGILAILLLLTSIALVALAWAVRRFRRN